MFFITAKLSRRKIAVFLFALIVLIAAVLTLLPRAFGSAGKGLSAETNDARVAYLRDLGWEVVPEPIETLRFRLPDELEEPYRSYNELQREQGFDLSAHCGHTVERYAYAVSNYPGRSQGCQADLYLCGGEIIGGDIVCTGEDGFMAPLAFPNTAQSEG
ncbi:MAG: DUF4830 domain-containing protein [Oscillospiraceae bacterium]|nr:DUF4830 domain-containing protein [Oscillospiraceae bacterium]